LPQASSPYIRFHIEHIVAQQHGGPDDADNLALSCGYCNHHKGPNIASLDPQTGTLVPLYHPRRDQWSDHFGWDDTVVVGKTPIGRATAELLGMNHWQRIELRENLQNLGEAFAG
jgi:hypothetical protein